jgi:hypothetical protein
MKELRVSEIYSLYIVIHLRAALGILAQLNSYASCLCVNLPKVKISGCG